MANIYEIRCETIDKKIITLEKFKNNVILIVNVASKWGATDQYKGLEDLYQKFKIKNFTVLGFPCNQFKQQEPEGEAEIKKFCRFKYGVSFPMFAKIDVNGRNTHPLYVYLKDKQPGILGSKSIKWNFTKFLVNRQGEVFKRYATSTLPEKIESDIKNLL